MSVKIFHFTTLYFWFLKGKQRHQVLLFCNSIKNQKHEVLPVIYFTRDILALHYS